jgi:hypothetical protein
MKCVSLKVNPYDYVYSRFKSSRIGYVLLGNACGWGSYPDVFMTEVSDQNLHILPMIVEELKNVIYIR